MKKRHRRSAPASDPEPDSPPHPDQCDSETPAASSATFAVSSPSPSIDFAGWPEFYAWIKSSFPDGLPVSSLSLLFHALASGPEERGRFLAVTGHPTFAKIMHHLAGELAGNSATADGLVELLSYHIRAHTLREIREEKLLTNDLVEIFGGLAEKDHRLFRVNGSDWIPLERREFILVKILEQHALARREARNTLRPVPDPFLRVATIIERIDALRASRPELAEFWVDIIDVDLHRVVSELRRKLSKHHLNPNLIETGPHHLGYRLSCRVGGVLPGLGPDAGDSPSLVLK